MTRLSDVIITPLRQIPSEKGAVFHGMKNGDRGFNGFGEAYFSFVNENCVKGWKLHTKMCLNIVVPVGEIQFRIFDRDGTDFVDHVLGPDAHYARMTVPPNLWMAFGGRSAGQNMLLNLADLTHDPAEARTEPFERFPWAWVG